MPYARGILLIALFGLLASAAMIGERWATVPPFPSPRSPRQSIIGQVRAGDEPLAGTRVRIRAAERFTWTDAEGRFRLPPQSGSSSRVTAWKDGYFIAGAPLGKLPPLINMQRLPLEDCERYAWVDPTPNPADRHRCGNCHGEIYREWAGSGHARSATGRHFLNLYDGSDWNGKPGVGWSLLDQHPDGAGVCTSCHAPTVRESAPAYFDLRLVQGVAARGVHCDYCHKITDSGLGQIGLTHGRFGLKLLRPAEGQLFFGPLDDVDRGEDAYSPLYRESRYCASCHEGTVFGVPVYTTYSEWLASPARAEGKQCQHCHMTPTGQLTNLAPGRGGIERNPWSLGNHRFFQGDVTAMLRDCLHLEIDVAPGRDGVRVAATLRADAVGHRVPTGFIDRHLLLVVQGFDRSGRLTRAKEGPLLPAAAGEEWRGQPGRLFGRLLTDAAGRTPIPFWEPSIALDDTRLHPGRPEQIEVQFPAATTHVGVRVIYRRFWHEVAQSKRWPDNDVMVINRTIRVQGKR